MSLKALMVLSQLLADIVPLATPQRQTTGLPFCIAYEEEDVRWSVLTIVVCQSFVTLPVPLMSYMIKKFRPVASAAVFTRAAIPSSCAFLVEPGVVHEANL